MKRKEGEVLQQVPMYINGQVPSTTTSEVCLTADDNSKLIHIFISCYWTRSFITDFQEVLRHHSTGKVFAWICKRKPELSYALQPNSKKSFNSQGCIWNQEKFANQ